jgi:hypothetical protein
MDTLDKIVNDNLSDFYSEMPDEGHFERFAKKMDQHHKGSVRQLNIYKSWYKIAAVLIILLGTSIVFFKYMGNNSNQSLISTLPGEYQEISNYYGSLVSTKYNEVKTLDKISTNKELLIKLSNELNDLDKSHDEILQDAQENPNDPMIMNAFMNLYKIKIDLIDRTIEDYNLISSNTKKYI